MRSPAILVSMVVPFFAMAQWSLDPADPLAICDAPNIQNEIRSIDDGSGGWYVFWRDARFVSSEYALYGQHVDADGYAQWTANGELIADHPGSNVVDLQAALMENGDVMLMYRQIGSGGDTIRALLMEPNGDPVWPNPVIIAQRESPLLSFEEFALTPAGTGALVAYHGVVSGGSAVNKIERINADGTLAHGINGFDVNNSAFGPMGIVPDGTGGAIVHWRNSNGGGTHMGVLRMDDMANLIWPAIVDPVAGTSGLAWAYNACSDGSGGLAIVYVNNEQPHQIMFARLDADGNSVITPSVKPVGLFNSGQDLPEIILHDGSFFVTWEDNRPPAANQDLFIQRLDMDGEPLWMPEGLLAIQGATYVPHAKVIPGTDDGVIVVQLSSSLGFRAQRIAGDGTPLWADPVVLATSNVSPFYGAFTWHADGLGGAASFWYNIDDVDLYGAHIDSLGNVGDHTGLTEVTHNAGISIAPNPSNGQFRITSTSLNSIGTIEVHNALGALVHTQVYQNSSGSMDLEHLGSGFYAVSVINDGTRSVTRVAIK